MSCDQSLSMYLQLPFDQGLARERELIAELFVSPQARALQYFFFAERQTTRIPGLESNLAKPIKEVGIIGAGTMGAGIAMNFIQVGIPVVILESKQEFLERGLENIKKNYAVSVKRGRMTESQVAKAMGLLKPTLNYGVNIAICFSHGSYVIQLISVMQML